MQTQPVTSEIKSSISRPIILLLCLFIGLGIFFRFYNLDKKVFWMDEVLTSINVAGYTNSEFFDEIFDAGEVTTAGEFKDFREGGVFQGIRDAFQVRVTGAGHPPLYYMLVRAWTDLWGESVTAYRLLSVLISLLGLPLVYWLCRELFHSKFIGFIATAILVTSPFHLLYSQETRSYSLLIVSILLSCAALLRAMRVGSKPAWLLYGVSLIIGCYTHLLFFYFIVMGHGLYMLITERFRISKISLQYGITLVLSSLVIAPWYYLIFGDRGDGGGGSWREVMSIPIKEMMVKWGGNFSRVFFDFNFDTNTSTFLVIPTVLVTCLFIGFALYYLFTHTSWKSRVFIALLTFLPFSMLALPDLITGGVRSITARYMIPTLIGFQLAAAYLLGSKLRINQRSFWGIVTVLVLGVGIVSCIVFSQSESWWNKKPNEHYSQFARQINQAENPLLIARKENSLSYHVVPLIYLLEPRVKVLLYSGKKIPEVKEKPSDIFVFDGYFEGNRKKLRIIRYDSLKSLT